MYENVTFLEYQKKKKEMLDDLGRTCGVCGNIACKNCPLDKAAGCNCDEAEMLVPEKALEIVMSYEPKVDWSKVPVDTKILVRDYDGSKWLNRYFAKYENGTIYAFDNGATSFSNGNIRLLDWNFAKLYKEE